MQCKTYRTQNGLLPVDESMRIPMVISLKQKFREFTSRLDRPILLALPGRSHPFAAAIKMAVGQAYYHRL